MHIDPLIARLLCSRLCHDLAGPAGAVSTGMELLGEAEHPSPENAQTMDFVIDSARQVTDRLAFYRFAFGAAGRGGKTSCAELRRLSENFIDRERFTVHWDCLDGDLDIEHARMVLTLILTAQGCLPRGGDISSNFGTIEGGFGIAIRASGKGARVCEDDRAALDLGVCADRLSARNVHVRWAVLMAAEMGGTLEVNGPPEGDRVSQKDEEVYLAALLKSP